MQKSGRQPLSSSLSLLCCTSLSFIIHGATFVGVGDNIAIAKHGYRCVHVVYGQFLPIEVLS